LATTEEHRQGSGCLQGDAAGTGEIAEMNYFAGVLNNMA
jgi:hypothetical protein